MTQPTRQRYRKTATLLVAITVVLSVFGPVGTVAAQDVTVTQSTTSTTAAPGETVTLQTTINVTDANAPGLQIQLPAGWNGSITDADGGAPKPETGEANVLEVVWFSSGNYTVTYEVFVPADAPAGDYTVDVEGSAIDSADGSRIVTSTQTTITVEAPNQAPTADAGPDQTVDEGSSVSLDASGSSDPDGDALSYSWTQTAGPTVTVSDDNSATPSFTAPEVDSDQTLTFELTVTDGNGASDTDMVNVTVQNVPEPNQVPIADAGPDQTVDEGNLTQLDGSNSSDPDGDSLSYQWSQVSGPSADIFDPSTATPSVSAPEVDTTQTLTFELTVTDGNGASDTDTVNVTVEPTTLGPIDGFQNPPTDPDGDGHYEDINGDGTADVVDVQALFANLNDLTIQNNPDKFDFNDDGTVNVVDVQKLFNEVSG